MAGAAAVAAALLALLSPDGAAVLDCACRRIADDAGTAGNHTFWENFHKTHIWNIYCYRWERYKLTERCETMEPLSLAAKAVALLVPWSWQLGAPPPLAQRRTAAPAGAPRSERGRRQCRGALQAARALPVDQLLQLPCHLMEQCIRACPAQGLNDTMWNEKTLTDADLVVPTMFRVMQAVRRITKVLRARIRCVDQQEFSIIFKGANITGHDVESAFDLDNEHFSKYWRDAAQLVSIGVRHLSHLFIPIAFVYMDIHKDDQQLHQWIKNTERVRNMLHLKFMGWLQDMESASKQMVNYKYEKDDRWPAGFIVRRPLLSEALLGYQEDLLSFHDDFGALCEQIQPNISKIFGLADGLYSFYRRNWFPASSFDYKNNTLDEEWELEDQSGTELSADTDCLQLLVDAVERPACPLQELPAEAARRRLQCRSQLWEDLQQRAPRAPVTSYLAYTQRAPVSLCLLAWMLTNSRSICQDVPFSMIQSVRDARCYFDNPSNPTCLQSNATDVVCCISRAILLLKCRDFSSFKTPKLCRANYYSTGIYKYTDNVTMGLRVMGSPTKSTLNYKESLNRATLRYKNFKVDSLRPLENTFVAVNIFFRCFSAAVYVYFRQLRNLPGKIFLSFQITGIVQIMCSEVLYRLVGFPSLAAAVLIDGALTLLGCLWLNAFCYQMYACVRHLRLPNDLPPSVASTIFRQQVLYIGIPWSIVCTTCSLLEKSSKYYLIHSRIILLTGISVSIAFNLIYLALVAYMYQRNKTSMKELKISTKDKHFSNKQVIFLSVNTFILSGTGVLFRIGCHQAEGIAQYVYYVHIATMLQGPLLFVFFVCNDTTLPLLKNRVLRIWNPEILSQERELCSSAERNRTRNTDDHLQVAESSL